MNDANDPRGEAKASLVLGALSLAIPLINILFLWLILGVTINTFSTLPFEEMRILITIAIFSFLPAIPLAIIGLILGIKGLKSTKKNLAIGGILLPLIGLVVVILANLLIR